MLKSSILSLDEKASSAILNAGDGLDTITLTKEQLANLLCSLDIKEHPVEESHEVRFNDRNNLKDENLSEFTIQESKTPDAKFSKNSNQENKEFTEWYPWGKPGCGAPLKRLCGSTGDLLHLRGQSPSWSHTDSNGCRFGTPLTTVFNANGSLKNVKDNKTGKYVPMAVASSVPLGDNDNAVNHELYREAERRRWLSDLENQVKEKKKKKEEERAQSEFNASRVKSLSKLVNSSPSPQNCLATNQNTFSPDINVITQSQEFLNLNDDKHLYSPESTFSNSGSIGKISPEFESGNHNTSDNIVSFHRGKNVFLDPDVMKQKEEKKYRALRYQQEIQAQIAENQRLKEEEKLKIQKEEELLEKKLLEQQEKMRLQYELEQRKIKEKQIAAEEKSQKVYQEMKKAEKEAEIEKNILKKFHSPLPAGVYTPDSCKTSIQVGCGKDFSPTDKSKDDYDEIKTDKIDKIKVDRATPEDSHHLLTPTVYRNKISYSSDDGKSYRDFGTQTNSNLDPSNKRKILRKNVSKKKFYEDTTSVSSSARSHEVRPKWGANRSKAAYVKQSEKDPYFEQKRKNYARRKQRFKRVISSDSDATSSTVGSIDTRNSSEYISQGKVQCPDSGFADDRFDQNSASTSSFANCSKSNCPIIRSNMRSNPSDLQQNRILQQLSDLRQGLLLKQIELQKLMLELQLST